MTESRKATRVKYVGSYCSGVSEGRKGTITATKPDGKVTVEWDSGIGVPCSNVDHLDLEFIPEGP